MARKTGPIKISPRPTLAARMPTVAVKAYAGATEEIPSMVPPKRPTTLLFRPLSAISASLLDCQVWRRSAFESVVLHDVLDTGVILQPVDGEVLAVAGVFEAAVRHL